MTADVLVARLVRDADGRSRFGVDLPTAEAVAAQVAGGAAVRLHTAECVGTVGEWARTIERSRPVAVLLVPNDATTELAELVARRAETSPWTVCSPLDLPSALADLTGCSAVDGASAYLTGVLGARHVLAAGLRLNSPTRLLAELDHVVRAAFGTGDLVLTADGSPFRWSSLEETVRAAVATRSSRLSRRGIDLLVRLPVAAIDSEETRSIAMAGIGRIQVVADLATTSVGALRGSVGVATADGLATTIHLAAHTADSEQALRLAAVLAAFPDLVLDADAEMLRSFSAAGALRGVLPHADCAVRVRRATREARGRVERAATGRYDSSPVTAGLHELWWDHEDAPGGHAGWLADVMATGGGVLDERPGRRRCQVAHVDVVSVPLDRPVAGWSQEGGAGVLRTVRTEPDRDALVTALDAAWRHGDLTSSLFSADAVGATCRIGSGACPAAGGRTLCVDAAGEVRVAHGGLAVGRIGSSLDQLREGLRALPAVDGCVCRPTAWGRHAAAPWTSRVLDAAAAVRRRVLPADDVRISGLGGALLHDLPPAESWPDGLVLLGSGDDHVLWQRSTGSAARLPSALAAVVEMRLDLGSGAARALAQRGVDQTVVQTVVSRADSALERLGLDLSHVPAPALEAS